MEINEILSELESLGSEPVRARNRKHGAGANQYGVLMGDIRALAKKLKSNHALALALWQTGNLDARFLAVLLMKPKNLSAADVEEMVCGEPFLHLADWFTANVIKHHPDQEALRLKWMTGGHKLTGRAGWSLTATRIEKSPGGLDLPGLLDRIEQEMGGAPPEVQWTMNFALAAIGIHHDSLRDRALAIGEKLGIYRDYPCSKGCTSPFAPIWINAMVDRKGAKS